MACLGLHDLLRVQHYGMSITALNSIKMDSCAFLYDKNASIKEYVRYHALKQGSVHVTFLLEGK